MATNKITSGTEVFDLTPYTPGPTRELAARIWKLPEACADIKHKPMLELLRQIAPSKANVAQAAHLLGEMAETAQRADQHCYWEHEHYDGESSVDPERVLQELNLLRSFVQRMGWLADAGHKALTGRPTEVRGEGRAEDWLLAPAYLQTERKEPSHAHD